MRFLCRLLGHRWGSLVIMRESETEDQPCKSRFYTTCTRCLVDRCVVIWIAPDPYGRSLEEIPDEQLRYVIEEE